MELQEEGDIELLEERAHTPLLLDVKEEDLVEGDVQVNASIEGAETALFGVAEMDALDLIQDTRTEVSRELSE